MIGTTLILAAVIYFLLRFVRTTRGSRLMRGLAIASLVMVCVLVVFLRTGDLEVLEHILTRVAGIAAIVLAVLFQPELRRGLAQLGEGSFLSRFVRRLSSDTIHELVLSVTHMAATRTGALIAIEGEVSLDAYVEGGVRIDASVASLLIESLFHPGNALHDGAVIIRKDRIAAAACLFPLTENLEIARSTGTRHRAALGLTDEADATVVVVSEETGLVSIAQNGVLRAGISVQKLESVLREALGQTSEADATRENAGSWMDLPRACWQLIRRDWMWIGASLLLGLGAYNLARLQLLVEDERPLVLNSIVRGETPQRTPGRIELSLVVPSDLYRVDFEPSTDHLLDILATQGEIADLIGGGLRGTFEIVDADDARGGIDLDQVRWDPEIDGVRYSWPEGREPGLRVEVVERRTIDFDPAHLPIDETNLNRRFHFGPENVHFDPTSIEIEAPAPALALLGSELELTYETIVLPGGTVTQVNEPVRLSDELLDLGFEILPLEGGKTPQVRIDLLPAERKVGVIERQISLVCLDPSRASELENLALPVSDQMARFTIYTSGLIPAGAEPGDPIVTERTEAILNFLDKNLRVFGDISELPPTSGRVSVSVQTLGVEKERWSQALENFIPKDLPIGELEGLELRLETAPVIILDRKPN